MNLIYANTYLKQFATSNEVSLYESNSEVLFPIFIETETGGRKKLANAYAFYLYQEPHKYCVHIFIDDNLSYGAFIKIFDTAVKNFKEKLDDASNSTDKIK